MKKAFILLGVMASLQIKVVVANTQVTATGQKDDSSVNCTEIYDSTASKENQSKSSGEDAKPSSATDR